MFNKVFISYATEDYKYAEEIYDFLLEQNFVPWMDKKKLLPGQKWDNVIMSELKHADFIVILFSETSVSKRGYVQKEFKIVLEYCEFKLESDIYVIPVKLNECIVPSKFDRYQWIDFSAYDFKDKMLEAIALQRNLLIEEQKKKSL